MKLTTRLIALAAVTSIPALAAAQERPAAPAGTTHDQHMAQTNKDAELKQHGHMAMDFDPAKATHHFTLTPTGGVIAVTANDAADTATRDQIRTHLEEIAAAFGKGNFEKPMMMHGKMPPGAADMQRHKTDIKYTFERSDKGGEVRIAATSDEAVKAVHEFLRYQIGEHKTGDPLTVKK